MAEPIEMQFGIWTRMGPVKHVLDGVHSDATWQIWMNHPCAPAMQPYIKLLWPLDLSFFLMKLWFSLGMTCTCFSSRQGRSISWNCLPFSPNLFSSKWLSFSSWCSRCLTITWYFSKPMAGLLECELLVRFLVHASRYIYKAETRTFVTQDLRRRRFSDKISTPMHINIT